MPIICWGDIGVGLIVGVFVGWWLHMLSSGEKPDSRDPPP